MSYYCAAGQAVTLRHACRNLAGSLVTGQASALTVTLSDPAGQASAAAVVKTEIGSTGWYRIVFTPTAVGVWVATVTNPAPTAGDGQATEYQIQAVTGGVLGAAPAYTLCTLEQVKRLLGVDSIPPPWKFDELLDELIVGVTRELEFRTSRRFGQWDHEDTIRGRGTSRIWLTQGPLQLVTGVERVVYGSPWTYEALDPVTYRGRGQGAGYGYDDGPASVELLNGALFSDGTDYRVTYTAGYSTIPANLALAAARLVVAHFRTRDVEGLASVSSGDTATQALTPADFDRLVERVASPWRFRVGGLGF